MIEGAVGPGTEIGATELHAAALREGVFAIMRRVEPASIEAIGEALAEAGWRFIEVSLSDADALDGIRRLCSVVGSRMWVGAGTVLTKRQAGEALEAGAQFLVSPGLRPEVADLASTHNVFHLPGVTTATEIASALDLGLTAMKLFPAGLLGPDYIRAMLGPFDHVQLFAVGNVNRDNIAELMRAGARGVGVGSSVVQRAPDGTIDIEATTAEARAIIREVKRGRTVDAPASTVAKEPPAFSSLLPLSSIRLGGSADDWRAAIRLAGEALTAGGAATPEYADEMIATVEKLGPYIVIAPGIALAHSRPSPAVHRTGLSWVTLNRPVSFGHPDNDPVGLVVGLAAIDESSHIDALSTLAGLLADDERRARLVAETRATDLRSAILRFETELADEAG